MRHHVQITKSEDPGGRKILIDGIEIPAVQRATIGRQSRAGHD